MTDGNGYAPHLEEYLRAAIVQGVRDFSVRAFVDDAGRVRTMLCPIGATHLQVLAVEYVVQRNSLLTTAVESV